MCIRDRPISPGSPWQNGIAQRLIGTVRRECLDRLLIFAPAVSACFVCRYYNQTRTHLALQKDAPFRKMGIATMAPDPWTARRVRI